MKRKVAKALQKPWEPPQCSENITEEENRESELAIIIMAMELEGLIERLDEEFGGLSTIDLEVEYTSYTNEIYTPTQIKNL